jgi:hypothetical protein
MNSVDMDRPARVATAVHEAGHAVVATLAGLSIRYVSIAALGGGGVTVVRDRRTFPMLEMTAVLCAGMAAEDITGVEDRWEIVDSSASGDVKNIREACREWHAGADGVTVLDLAARSWALAFDMVVENYGAVLAVAERLHAGRKALTGPEVRACIAGASTMRPEVLAEDGRTFWVPAYSALRNWGPARPQRQAAMTRAATNSQP